MGTLDFSTVLSLSLGIIVLMIYTIKRLKQDKVFPDIGKALSVLLPGIAIPQGIYVCKLAFSDLECISVSPTFLMVGGLSIVWISADKIIKMFKGESDDETLQDMCV